MTKRTTAVPLLKWRKWPRNSSVSNCASPVPVEPPSRAAKRAVGKRIAITLNGCVSLSMEEGGVHLPNRQERVVELRHMWMEMLFPNA